MSTRISVFADVVKAELRAHRSDRDGRLILVTESTFFRDGAEVLSLVTHHTEDSEEFKAALASNLWGPA